MPDVYSADEHGEIWVQHVREPDYPLTLFGAAFMFLLASVEAVWCCFLLWVAVKLVS